MSADKTAMKREESWAIEAAERVRQRIELNTRGWEPHKKGLLATIQTSYRPSPLPPGFEVLQLEAAGVRRRAAISRAPGRPVLLLPGLYASLDEGLFIRTALLIHRKLKRPVILLEDRFAKETLRLNGECIPTLRELGEEAAFVASQALRLVGQEVQASWGDEDDGGDVGSPDVLAFSAGAASALAAPGASFARAVLWSAAINPRDVLLAVKARPLVNAYFRLLHERTFKMAGIRPVPSRRRLVERLCSDQPLPPEKLPLLAVHAKDDPVAPSQSLRILGNQDHQATCILFAGGHLGFAAVAGDEIYLVPLLK